VDAIWTAIEHWPLARGLKTAFIAYPLVSALHVLSIGTLLSSVGLMHLRLAGYARELPTRAFVGLLRRVALTAFGFALLSGTMLFTVRASDYAASPLFLAKLTIIALAVANFLLFSTIEGRTPESGPRPPVLKVLAVASIGMWLAALLCGRFLGFV
jgi:hypothetical protein